MSAAGTRAQSRSAARLAAVQALYQQEMEQVPLPQLLHEFHAHRLGATIEDVAYADAEVDFFDDVVSGTDARRAEIDALIAGKLASGWTLERLDRPMRQILRAGTYELLARPDVPAARSARRGGEGGQAGQVASKGHGGAGAYMPRPHTPITWRRCSCWSRRC